jgi:arylsulfatase A-like enzyme
MKNTKILAVACLGYATGQFGKNHLGDRNEFLPTVHGFDEKVMQKLQEGGGSK